MNKLNSQINNEIKREVSQFNKVRLAVLDDLDMEPMNYPKLHYNSKHFKSLKKTIRKVLKQFPDAYFYFSHNTSDGLLDLDCSVYPFKQDLKDRKSQIIFFFSNAWKGFGYVASIGRGRNDEHEKNIQFF